MAVSQLHVVMIGVFPADRDHMGCEVRCRVPTWCQRVSDDLGALACRDLEKVVAEILNDGLGRVCDGSETSGHMQVSTSGFTTSGPEGDQKEGQNRQRKPDMSQQSTPLFGTATVGHHSVTFRNSQGYGRPAGHFGPEPRPSRPRRMPASSATLEAAIRRPSRTHTWHSLTPPFFWTMMRAWSSSRQQWSILARPQGTARRFECGLRFFWCSDHARRPSFNPRSGGSYHGQWDGQVV